jgi:glycosyltransferase involved in cell wall biosynthesis
MPRRSRRSPILSRRQRVLIGIPCLLVGGTEVHTLALATALRSGGFDVSVCCYHEHDDDMVRMFRDRGIDVDLLNVRRSASRFRIGGAQSLFRSFAEVVSRRRPDVAHLQYMTPGAIAVTLARLAGIKRVVATVHVTANHYGSRRWIPRHLASRMCDAFLCVSKTAEHSFFGKRATLFEEDAWRGGRRHFTIHNCVDLVKIDAMISGAAEATAPSARSLVVGIVGRLDRFKGHDVLLDAIAQVKQRRTDVTLLVVGDGEQHDALCQQARRLGIGDSVTWTGRVPPDQVSAHLRRMDVVAMPSRPGLEGFGLAAAEAMAHSKPVVASRVDGLVEVIGEDEPGNEAGGVLVQPCDSESLAAAIERLLNDPAERAALGASGRRRVERLFSPRTFADRHLRLYAALCGARN